MNHRYHTIHSLFLLSMVLFGLLPKWSSAQIDFRPGYIVNQVGDTTKGWIAYRGHKKNQATCVFRESKGKKSVVFGPNELKAFGIFQSNCYESIEFPADSPVQGRGFALSLEDGAIRLLHFDDFFLVFNGSEWTVLTRPRDSEIRSADRVMVTRDQRYIGLLNNLMDDCIDKYQQFRYSQKEIANRVQTYNKCKNPKHTGTRTRITTVKLRVVSGYQLSKIKYDFDNKFTLSGGVPFGGVGAQFSTSRRSDKIFFLVDALFLKAQYTGGLSFLRVGDPVRREITFDVTSLKVPFGMKYHLKGGKLSPYVSAGFYWSGILNSHSKSVDHRIVQNVATQDIYLNEYHTKNPKGYWLGAGVSTSLEKKIGAYVEVRQEGGEGYIGDAIENDSKLVTTSFLLGVRF